MNSYFRWYRMDDDLRVEYAETRLGGQAKIFWENECIAAERRGQPIATWAEMARKLRAKYVPRQYQMTFFLSWLDLRQGRMTTTEYIEAFEECRMRCRFVEDPRVVIGVFTHGLHPGLRNEVLKCNPSEVDEAYHIIEHMDVPLEETSGGPATTTARAAASRSTFTTPARTVQSTGGQRPAAAAGGRRLPPSHPWALPHSPDPHPLRRRLAARRSHQQRLRASSAKGRGTGPISAHLQPCS